MSNSRRMHSRRYCFNLPAGDWDAGERGIASLPDRIDEFRRGLMLAIEYATVIGCSTLHVMAGKLAPTGDRERQLAVFTHNLLLASDAVAAKNIELMIEPINRRVDIPDYLIECSSEDMSVIERVARPNVRLQYDVYHMQIVEGDLARTIHRLLPHIGHIQIADNPGRNEPGTGEINFDWLLQHIDAMGYRGWIGCEYRPRTRTLDGLRWASRYLNHARESRP